MLLLQILNGLEGLGHRVVTSSSIVTGFEKYDTKWVLFFFLLFLFFHFPPTGFEKDYKKWVLTISYFVSALTDNIPMF